MRRGILSNPRSLAGISLIVFAGLALLLWAPWERRGLASGQLVLYCAAGMHEPVAEIIDEFHRECGERYGLTVRASYGGSGELLARMQIEGGSENHLFLSADAHHMLEAQRRGLVAESIPVAYLEPVLIVSSKTQDRLRREGKPLTGVRDLLRDDLEVIIGIPEHTAIGRATKQLLSRPDVDLWKDLQAARTRHRGRVTEAGTVNEVVQKVFLHDRAVGIAWRSVAEQYRQQGNALEIVTPPEFASAKMQVVIGVSAQLEGERATPALQFARYLTARDRGLRVFAKHYYNTLPDGDAWAERPEVYLSAGAMLQPGIEETLRAFAKREGVIIHTDYAGCGLLVDKMHAAKSAANPTVFPDAYFACDTAFLEMVQHWFDVAEIVSANRMVLIVRKGNPKNIRNLHDLVRRDVKEIGLGHPTHSALGKLTDDLLKKVGLHDELYAPGSKGRIVHESAGHDLVAKLRRGLLDVAIVYESNARADPEHAGHLEIVPLDVSGALAQQPFAIARDSRHRYLMRRLLAAIVARPSADRFRSLGFVWVYGVKQ